MTRSHYNALGQILGYYDTIISPFHLCPPPLFVEIVKINYLRNRGAKLAIAGAEDLSREAYQILDRVGHFASERWASSKTSSAKTWAFIGRTYQSAVVLYCISSLQSQSILPQSPSLRDLCVTHARTLHIILQEGLSFPQIKRFMLWALVLLGVEAVNGDAPMRAFVSNQLAELSRDAGTYAPLTAKSVLESFWASSETRWDACFDRPYVFTTQLAVDTSRISTP